MTEPVLDRAKQAAATAQTLALVAFVIIAVTLAINYGAASFHALAALPDSAAFFERARALLTLWVAILPALFFLGALASLRRALREYEKGEFFSPRSARAVRRAGEEAFTAMLAQFIIVPLILAGIGSDRADFHFELTDLALLAFVVFVAAVGRVLDIAVALKAENDQIV